VYDSAKMADVLAAEHGLELTDDVALADVVLVNTCSIREKAQEKVFSQLGRWKKLKQANPDVIIGVGGCVASQEGAAILDRAPYVDLVFGPQTLHRLPAMIDARRKPAGRNTASRETRAPRTTAIHDHRECEADFRSDARQRAIGPRRRPVEKEPERTQGPHREHALRELRGRRAADWPVR
jgi:tRNA A37 methylthiotransferase MiaB